MENSPAFGALRKVKENNEMGTMTEQMESLAGDILSGREDRSAALAALRESVAEMREENRVWLRDNNSWVESLQEAVEEMREANRAWLEENRASVEGIRSEVEELLSGFKSDLEGARQAWQAVPGSSAVGRSAVRSSSAAKPPERARTTRTKTRARRSRSK